MYVKVARTMVAGAALAAGVLAFPVGALAAEASQGVTSEARTDAGDGNFWGLDLGDLAASLTNDIASSVHLGGEGTTATAGVSGAASAQTGQGASATAAADAGASQAAPTAPAAGSQQIVDTNLDVHATDGGRAGVSGVDAAYGVGANVDRTTPGGDLGHDLLDLVDRALDALGVTGDVNAAANVDRVSVDAPGLGLGDGD